MGVANLRVGLYKRVLSRVFAGIASLAPQLVPLNRWALRLDRMNPLAGYVELDRRSGGTWGLKNAVFEKDAELMRLFMRYGEHQKAQLLQDLAYLKFFYPPPGEGFFVEVGVGDGTHLSNTFLFEREFGWSGLLVEPNPRFHEAIRNTRQARLDTRAAFNADQQATLLLAEELSQLSGVGAADEHTRVGSEIDVSTSTLTRILDEADAPARIDFMSVDTEGSELEVLKGLDFERYRVDFLSVEHNFVGDKRSALRRHMQSAGYRCVSTAASFWDDWFILAR